MKKFTMKEFNEETSVLIFSKSENVHDVFGLKNGREDTCHATLLQQAIAAIESSKIRTVICDETINSSEKSLIVDVMKDYGLDPDRDLRGLSLSGQSDFIANLMSGKIANFEDGELRFSIIQ